MRRAGVVLLLVASCGGSHGLSVTDAWSRSSPGVADTGAFYVTVSNDGPEDDVLLSADSDRCGTTLLHNTLLEDDVMNMVHVDSLELQAGEELVMAPGGFHLMCVGLSDPLIEGETVELILTFEKAGDRTALVSVEDR